MGSIHQRLSCKKKVFGVCRYSNESFKNLSKGGKSEGAVSVRNRIHVLLNRMSAKQLYRVKEFIESSVLLEVEQGVGDDI